MLKIGAKERYLNSQMERTPTMKIQDHAKTTANAMAGWRHRPPHNHHASPITITITMKQASRLDYLTSPFGRLRPSRHNIISRTISTSTSRQTQRPWRRWRTRNLQSLNSRPKTSTQSNAPSPTTASPSHSIHPPVSISRAVPVLVRAHSRVTLPAYSPHVVEDGSYATHWALTLSNANGTLPYRRENA